MPGTITLWTVSNITKEELGRLNDFLEDYACHLVSSRIEGNYLVFPYPVSDEILDLLRTQLSSSAVLTTRHVPTDEARESAEAHERFLEASLSALRRLDLVISHDVNSRLFYYVFLHGNSDIGSFWQHVLPFFHEIFLDTRLTDRGVIFHHVGYDRDNTLYMLVELPSMYSVSQFAHALKRYVSQNLRAHSSLRNLFAGKTIFPEGLEPGYRTVAMHTWNTLLRAGNLSSEDIVRLGIAKLYDRPRGK